MLKRSGYFYGILFAVVGSLLFSTKAIFVKLAYQHDVDSVTLLALRMLFALPIYLIILASVNRNKQSKKPSRSFWLQAVLAAFSGFYLASFLDFWGLQFVDASIERLILFLYPTFLVLMSAAWLKEKITKSQFGALILSYIGLIWVFSPNFGSFTFGEGFWMGALAILLCALAYAFYMVMSQKLIPVFGTIRYTSIAMIFASFFVIGHYLIQNPIALFTEQPKIVYLYAIGMATIATILPSYITNFAIQRIGAARTGIIASIGPLSTITLAYILLGERLAWQQWVGTVFIIGGVTFLTFERRRS